MDYSSINSHEDPADPSPWASSPQHNRSSFGRTSTDLTPSINPVLPQSSFPPSPEVGTLAQDAHDESFAQRPPIPEDESAAHSSTLPYRTSSDYAPAEPHPQDLRAQNEQQHPYQHQQYQHEQEQQQQQLHQPTPQRPPHQYQPNTNRPPQRHSHPKYTLQAKVNGLERSGRASKDPMLRFDIYTNLPDYRTTQFRDVRRSHSEFQKLADHLISANPEALVPALPPSSTPAGVGTDEDETKIKAYMQRWLNAVCSNEVLMLDEEMVRFIEGDPGYSPVMRRSQPATGVRRKYIKQFAPPPDDTPELQEARPIVKMFYLGTMDSGQKIDKVVKTRRGLGLAEADFGQRVAAMSEQETHPGLKNAYRKLGRTVQTVGDLHAAQGTAEATTLGDPLSYHSGDAFIVKETLTNRHILLRELLQAQQATRSKLSATDRLKSSTSVRRDKVDEAISALDEARSHESYLFHKTQRVTANLVHENRKWFARTATDLRAAIREYVLREIEAERRCLATLEAVRPDIRAIDASGGLSRLGREAPPATRRAAIMSSQGPKGDAWSGVQRRGGDGLNRSISAGYVAPPPPAAGSVGAAGGLGSEAGDEGSMNGDEGGAAADAATGRQRSLSGAGSLKSVNDDDEDRVDARNAASRLATSTF